MSAAPARSFRPLAVAIVVAALVVSGAVLASSSFSRTTISTTTATNMTASISTLTVTSVVPVTSTVTETATSTSTVTSTSVSTATSTYEPFVAPLLQVELNTTEVGYHGGLNATITLTNLLPYNVSFVPTLPANSSLLNWAAHDGLCGGTLFPDLFAFAVLQGHYTSANLSSAKPLTMAPPLLIECPASPTPNRFVFLPNSSRYTAHFPGNSTSTSGTNETLTAMSHPSTGDCVLIPAGYVSCFNGSLFGYWVWNSSSGPPYFNFRDANTTSKFFNYFPPGEYTLVVQDIWGATLFSYFQVATAPS